jgi:YD repeat-containing protein
MARGGHGLPKVSLGLAMPYPFAPWGRATPQTGMAYPQGGQPAAVFYPFGHPLPYAYDFSSRSIKDRVNDKQTRQTTTKLQIQYITKTILCLFSTE